MSIQGGNITLAAHVMNQGIRAADWFMGSSDVTVAMLIPTGDPMLERYPKFEIFEGPEDDVLTRYYNAMLHYKADYVVRLTADCAWMTSAMIHKCIHSAFKYGADYCSNVLVRTFAEGLDVEVLSSRLLGILNKRVTSKMHREHVTSDIERMFHDGELPGFIFHTVFAEYDYSSLKTSIDTKEEYDRSNTMYNMLRSKREHASLFGSISS